MIMSLRRKRLLSFVTDADSLRSVSVAFARGVSQVMFQRSALAGWLFLAGIFWGAYECGTPQVAWGAVVGAGLSMATGFLTVPDKTQGEAGLWGFNGTLVGCALPVFLADTWPMWALLVFLAILAPGLQRGLNGMMSAWKINSLTFPFVFLTWLALMAARQFDALPLSVPAEALAEGEPDCSPASLAVYWLKGIAQVFLVNSWVAGLFFVMALAVSSWRAAIWAMVGSGIALGISVCLEASPEAVSNGLYGFSPVHTAIALGNTFFKPGVRTAVITLAAIVFTVLVQGAMNALMLPWGIPTLTAPFCVATWLFLLPEAVMAGEN